MFPLDATPFFIIMKAPEFAIFQNSQTRQTSVWVANEQKGEWVERDLEEYDTMRLIAQLIRTSKDPEEILKGIKLATK